MSDRIVFEGTEAIRVGNSLLEAYWDRKLSGREGSDDVRADWILYPDHRPDSDGRYIVAILNCFSNAPWKFSVVPACYRAGVWLEVEQPYAWMAFPEAPTVPASHHGQKQWQKVPAEW